MATVFTDPIAWARRNAGTRLGYWGRGLLHISLSSLALFRIYQHRAPGSIDVLCLVAFLGAVACGIVWPIVYLECIRRLIAELDRRDEHRSL